MHGRREHKFIGDDGRQGSTSEQNGRLPRIAHRKHKRSGSTHSSWLEGLGTNNDSRKKPGQHLGSGNHVSMTDGQELADAEFQSSTKESADSHSAALLYAIPRSYPLRAAHPHFARVKVQEPTPLPPPVRVRRFTASKSGAGPYEWTLPQFLYCMSYSPRVLIRRFLFWLENDRTQFEGFEMRKPGALSNWKTHGSSNLRNVVYSSYEVECHSQLQHESSLEDIASRPDRYVPDNQYTPLLISPRATWNGIYGTFSDDCHSFCASTMDLNEQASLFKDEPQSRSVFEIDGVDIRGAHSLIDSRVQQGAATGTYY